MRLPLGGARQRALLALLLTRANEIVSVDRLVDDLWGGEPPRTAVNTLQYYVSQLRKVLGAERILTQPPGYVIRVAPGELDLHRFERLVERGGAERLREAIALWRGAPLADFVYEPFAQAEIARLGELRLAALEERVELDLALGRHAQLVGELEALIREHPLRERLRGQLMVALYRSGRQAEALEAYQDVRRALVEELGIEPGPPLQRLERAVLVHDAALDLEQPHAQSPGQAEPSRTILIAPRGSEGLDALVGLAERLAGEKPGWEVIIACLTSAEALGTATALANERRARLAKVGVASRAVAFTSASPGEDLARLATEQEVELVLTDCRPGEDVRTGDLRAVLAGAPCDLGLLLGGRESPDPGPNRPVLVPFGGAEHDWAAVEVAAWIAAATGATLTLAGAEGNRHTRKRDASRLLANASLLIQRAVGVATEPLLIPPNADAIVSAAEEASLIVAGLSDRWHLEGVGETRAEIARRARPPLLLARRGLRPGGIAPRHTLTRFTWSIKDSR